MAGPYQILDARVKQKTDTEQKWLQNDLVLLEGEQAFVVDDAGVPQNFKLGTGDKKFSDLPYYITYRSDVISHKLLTYLNKTGNFSVQSTFRNFSNLHTVIFYNDSGNTVTLNIGTTANGSDIAQIAIPAGANEIDVRWLFTAPTTVYFSGLTGVSYSMIVVYFQYDEAPVAAPSSSGSFRFPKGFKGMYEEVTTGDYAATWDATTGMGKAGSKYENCVLSGTNGTQSMAGFMPMGISTGEVIGQQKGSANNQLTLTINNLPKLMAWYYANGTREPGNQAPVYDGTKSTLIKYSVRDTAGNEAPDVTVPIDITPKSKTVLYFVAITD